MAAVYFAYLSFIAVARRKWRAAGLASATLFCILTIGMLDVMPLVYLLVGYWIPALLVRKLDMRVEQQLLDFDRRLFGPDGLARFERTAPRPVLEYLELAYLLCYAVVPAGYACLLIGGHGAAVQRYWFIVLLASFLCYGVLPWIATRAPRVLDARTAPARSSLRRFNIAVLDRGSVQWNTFPSGHTGASVAAALAVAVDMPLAGFVLGLIAVSIAAGSVAGRYHYAADAFAGAAVAVVAFVTAYAVHGL